MAPTPIDDEPAPGEVSRAGHWAVANVDGTLHAVSRRVVRRGGKAYVE